MWWQRAQRSGELDRTLALINSMARAAWPDEVLDALFELPRTRLAAYGTLRPGESNHAKLSDVGGTWVEGTVRGVRFMANGYPAFEWRPGEHEVPVGVLTSAALPAHWPRLDDFEGIEYHRILVPVRLSNDTNVVAYLYEYSGGLALPDVLPVADW